MTFKKILGLTTTLAAAVLLAACAPSSGKEDKASDKGEKLTVGVMAFDDTTEPLWDEISALVKKEGVTLNFVQFTDYTQPNTALNNGEVDVNAFQHYDFLNNWNKENDGDLVAAADTLLSPIHLFSGTEGSKAKYKDVSELPEGAVIAVPNDATNESRALYVLESAGIINLEVPKGEIATLDSIVKNSKNVKIKEVAADQLAANLVSVDAAIINNAFAQSAGINYETSLYKEEVNEGSKQWVNIIAAQKDWEKSDKADAIKKLISVYQTDEIAKVLNETSKGIDIPAWEGAPTFN
ncbi:MetQ/NlpA family ABC transporter substrate-binding protein [Streptococcus sp. S784/96/1]|uniref:MetQ/NlpA family ABC transporter substrate-binding protein n=1 Tax=Streptococcus sp. S784/96/1 TaxID=2653499 RepID=UPI001386E75D|nr:MetQ/NlpA family ABC transporter substrate-binding protein [Streptococcus sp. S784/96/1]